MNNLNLNVEFLYIDCSVDSLLYECQTCFALVSARGRRNHLDFHWDATNLDRWKNENYYIFDGEKVCGYAFANGDYCGLLWNHDAYEGSDDWPAVFDQPHRPPHPRSL
jgi:hypothetical protein